MHHITGRIIGGLSLGALVLVGGCASRESRIESALAGAGVSAKLAACLAPRLADRLTDDQLRALAAAARREPGNTGKVSAREIVARVAGIGDPAIVDIVSGATLHCALKG